MNFAKPPTNGDAIALNAVIRGTGGILLLGFAYAFFYTLRCAITLHWEGLVCSLVYLVQPHFPDFPLTSPRGVCSLLAFWLSIWAFFSLKRRYLQVLLRVVKPKTDPVDYSAIFFRRLASS